MTDEQFEKLNALAKTNPDDACAILVEKHIDELKAKDKMALWISDNIEKAKLAKTAAYEGCKRTLEAFRDKGVDTRALAELLNRADEAEVLDIETMLN